MPHTLPGLGADDNWETATVLQGQEWCLGTKLPSHLRWAANSYPSIPLKRRPRGTVRYDTESLINFAASEGYNMELNRRRRWSGEAGFVVHHSAKPSGGDKQTDQ